MERYGLILRCYHSFCLEGLKKTKRALARTFQKLSVPRSCLEKWPIFLPFLCYNMQMQYHNQNLAEVETMPRAL
jgi:hypothetical protein